MGSAGTRKAAPPPTFGQSKHVSGGGSQAQGATGPQPKGRSGLLGCRQRRDVLRPRRFHPALDDVGLRGQGAIADPGPFGLFLGGVYDRGAATLHALRVKVGDGVFFAASEEWLTRYDDSTATTADFEAVFEEVSGQDLTTFFNVWVRTPSKPTSW